MNSNKKIKVLFVCMGNICRSPTAHGVFRSMVAEQGLAELIEVDSAGTHAYHVGQPPDRRSAKKALEFGIDIADLRARQAVPNDFKEFDYVLAMDHENYSALRIISPTPYRDRLHLFLTFTKAKKVPKEVPDPYYGGSNGFDIVYSLVEQASIGLLDHIKKHDLR